MHIEMEENIMEKTKFLKNSWEFLVFMETAGWRVVSKKSGAAAIAAAPDKYES